MTTQVVLWGALIILAVLYLMKRRSRLRKED